MMKKYGAQISFILLLIANLFLIGYYLNQKQGWHVDEQYSYGHANSTQGAFLTEDIDSFFIDKKTDLHNKKLEGKIFHDYLTVQNNERFHYGHIKENLAKSVHPPLFYYLLHTVCSLTPDTFSPWQAGSLNLIFFILTIFVFYKLCKLFIKDEYLAMMPVFLWGFSEAGLSTAIFLRMYMLQTLLAVCLLYEVSKMLLANEAENKRLFLIFVYATLGNLTQFSSLVFAFFVTLVAGVVLLYRKNWKVLFFFFLMMLLSVAALFAIYPQAYEVLFHSVRGEESAGRVNSFLSHFSTLWMAVVYSNSSSRMFEIYFNGLFGIEKVLDVILLAIAIFVAFFIYRKKVELNKAFLPMLALMMLMTFYLNFMMPDMGIFQLRYYMLLMPAASLVLVYLTIILLHAFGVRKVCIGVLMVLVVVTVLWRNDFRRNAFFVPITKETIAAKSELYNKRIIIKTPVYAVFDVFSVLKNADKVYWAKDDDDISEALDDADFVLIFNSYATTTLYTPIGKMKSCLFCISRRKPLLKNETERLKYVAQFRSGVVNFDLYGVVKK